MQRTNPPRCCQPTIGAACLCSVQPERDYRNLCFAPADNACCISSAALISCRCGCRIWSGFGDCRRGKIGRARRANVMCSIGPGAFCRNHHDLDAATAENSFAHLWLAPHVELFGRVLRTAHCSGPRALRLGRSMRYEARTVNMPLCCCYCGVMTGLAEARQTP